MRYLFQDYEFDTERRELRRGAEIVSVAPQVFDLLDHLIRNRERVVSKDDLINTIWKGRSVSDAALTTRLNVARTAIGDSGEAQRLIKTFPRKGFRFVGHVQEVRDTADGAAGSGPGQSPKHVLTPPDKPSIAVLPFQNMSGDREQDYFADGMSENIITALSRFRSLFVIARNSSFTYKGRAVDIKQVGRELGVRYVVEGSVRRAGRRVRITGQLIEAATNVHLWADQFDGELDDVFDLQDRVTERIAVTVDMRLQSEQGVLAQRKPTDKLDAYDYVLRANAVWRHGDREANEEALRLAYKAIELDPRYGGAYARAALCINAKKHPHWMVDPQQETAEAMRLARLAITFGSDDEAALAAAALVFGYLAGELDAAASLIDQAVELNPNSAFAWSVSGWLRLYMGAHELAIEHQNRAMRLSPRDPSRRIMISMMSAANFFLGRFEIAERIASEAVQLTNGHLPTLRMFAASLAMQGKRAQAEPVARRILSLDPTFRLSGIGDLIPLRRQEDLALYIEAMRLAGIPE
ncbi:CadC-family transcriptional regulator [Bradyrhizobium sp. NAS80.1]|uniref:winged helix-turn-helix domain-containing tetratricopeptide repeat protein n=1 Tax=Bradyrhizobium sp. NAS80.1 TaxID=1680159 RepID=UPI000968CBD6|nr:winged helix-turn-helix domain-containing tetratricopeptide repeat protein [Bradyrhizobium sp. NAS80.1]OKO88373.1 CadC-family transcriptional regulator [Bradyrhizobium sp. NAS80.1]